MTKFYNISTDNTLGGNSPSDVTVSSQKAVKDYVDNYTPDGVLNSQDNTTKIKTWVGTKAQYDAIATKDSNTLYNVTDDSTTLSIPSTKFINLTLGASGSTYTAPADGWIYWRKKASAVNQVIALIKILDNNTSTEASVMWAVNATNDLYANMPVRKGEVFGANYTAAGSSSADFFRFVYAVGSESEAT